MRLEDDIWHGLELLQEALADLANAEKKLKKAKEQLPGTLQRDGNVPEDLEKLYQLLRLQIHLSDLLLGMARRPLPHVFTQLNKIRNMFRLGWVHLEEPKKPEASDHNS